MTVNPLLDFSGLPRYGLIRAEHVEPAIDQLLAENRALIARLTAEGTAASWDEFAEPLESANERLGRAWGAVAHLQAVDDNAAIRDAYNANLSKVTLYRTQLAQNLGLYEKFKALRASSGFEKLTRAKRKSVDNDLRDYRLGGAELAPDEKRRFTEIQEELAALEAKFSENLLDATNAFSLLITDPEDLLGVPEDVVEAGKEAARKEGKEGWKLTLHAPSYGPLMQYSENRDLRERLYRAHVTRASEFGDPELDNTPIILRELRLRKEKARLLGYKSFSEFSLVPKMAESPEAALDFLNDLGARALPHARRDYAELEEFARAELGLEELGAWDVAFASEKLRVKRYAFSDQEVKRYFPEPKVLEGMFRLVEALYGIRILPDEAETWHPQVRFFRITDSHGGLIGQFYLDPYSRETKRGGAWMDEAITRQRIPGGLRTPVAHLVCNFPAPLGNKPALFTHDEVITLFHEFGHGLHHLLSRVDDLGVSGIRGVEWDAVEMHLHHDYDPAGAKAPLQLLNEIQAKVAVVMPPEYSRFLNNFSHVFAGGYAAGYYSYKWAEVLSADAYSLFEQNGVFDPGTGARFRDEILAVGGSRPALESFKAFRGREPRIDALLRHNGMIAP